MLACTPAPSLPLPLSRLLALSLTQLLCVQNEKRQLETNLVVEQRIQNRETDKDSTASQSDDERDEDDAGSTVSNGDGTQDIFFECNTDLGRVSGQQIPSGGATTSGSAQQYSQPQGIQCHPFYTAVSWLHNSRLHGCYVTVLCAAPYFHSCHNAMG